MSSQTQRLKELWHDPVARETVRRAHARDLKHGSGDMMDFALFVYDETMKAHAAQVRKLEKLLKEALEK